METKAIGLEFKDIDTSKRTAVIAHAVYNNIDRTGDISCKGMFDKTWKENKNIEFLFNHEEDKPVGTVLKTFEDDEKAYTEVKFGDWTLGNDVLEMASDNVLRGASFGYVAEKKDYVNIKGKKIRKLQEVKHIETSLLTKTPANPLAGVVKLQKSFELLELKTLSASEQETLKSIVSSDQSILENLINIAATLTDPKSDLYTWVFDAIARRANYVNDIRYQLRWNSGELKALSDHKDRLEKFCRNTKASDECIKGLLEEKENIEQILINYNTSNTHSRTTEPLDSIEQKDLLSSLQLFTKSLKN